MNNGSARKIVSINAAGRERGPGLRVVADCTDRLSDALCMWLAAIREPIGEELFRLADGTQDRKLQARYLDLRRDVERDWTQFIEAFRHGLTEDRSKGTAGASALEVPDFDGLQLVDDAALSEHIVVREFAAQLAETCDEELYALDRRVAALLGREEADDDGNPLGPEPLCQVLVDASASLGLDAEDRLLLVRRIERHLHQALPAIYREINEHLAERGILPDLKRSYQRTAQKPPTTQRRGGSAAAEALQEAAATLPAGADILGTLQRLATARGGQGAFGAPVPSVPSGPNRDGAACPASISHAFLASLNEAQHGGWQPAAGGAINQVEALRGSPFAQQVSPLESVTIDIVAMLFDFIFNDDELPDSVKLLVGKLQIPVLKVAMLDQSFFANRQHPARRFLDGITGIALHWGQGAEENDPFLLRLAESVERIQREFETNVEIFSAAIADLEAFVSGHEAQEEETLSIATEAAARREAEEAVAERVQAALQPILEQAQPEVVRAFLGEHWAAVLQQKGRAHEEDSAAWRESVEVAEQLVWSVASKAAGDERMRLISTLPMLLARINAGLSTTGISTEARSAFFDALVELHAAALKGSPPGGKSTAPAEAAVPSAPAPVGEGDLLVTRRVEDGVTIEDVMLVGAAPMRRARDREVLAQVRGLKRGDWVDFIDAEGKVARERLNWLSPHKGILVFSNHRAAKAISISPEALARQIRDGAAQVVGEEASVFGKAIDGVMHSLGAA
ncbi:MAG TPA: DUF1631 family protein [Azospira sp.]|nr:DUF1631 family protein [Azospira sp.]